MTKPKLLLLLLALSVSSQLAWGWYDPGAQRWINRDPYNEPGFETIRQYRGAGGETAHNAFVYVGNQPVSETDALGLWKFNKCSPQQVKDIKAKLAARCSAAQKNNCFKCLSGNKQKAMNGLCNDTAKGMDEITIVCEDKNTDLNCKTQDGYSYPDSRVSHICYPNTQDVGCIALHEGAHSVGGVGDDTKPAAPNYDPRAYDIAQCAGCPRRPGY